MMNSVLFDARIKKLFVAFLLFSGIYLVFAFMPKEAHAVNQSGWGWSIPVGRTNDPSCFPTTANRTWVKILLVDSVTKASVNANIRIEDPGGTISAQGFGNFLEMPCAVTNRGVWVSVWGAGGYRAWDLSTNFNGRSNNYNWCCGYQFLDAAADDGKTVTFQILLVPNSISIPTITANSPTGTSIVDPLRTIIPATGATTPVNFNITTGSICPCGAGSRIINRYIWARNIDTGAIVLNQNLDGFVGNFGFGANLNYTANLPVGRYQWYMQTEEDRRNYVFIPNTLPITSQFPWQYFEVARPNLVATVSNPGTVTAGTNIIFTGTSRNTGSAATPGPFFVRFCLDATPNGSATCYAGATPTGSTQGAPSLASNAQTPNTWNWVATPGPHTIYFCADINSPTGAFQETDDSVGSNCAPPQTFTVNPVVGGQPDLVVDSLAANPNPATVGQNITFTAVVRNAGNAGTGVGFTNRFCLNNNNCYTSTLLRLNEQAKPALGVGGTVTVTFQRSFIAPINNLPVNFCTDVVPLPPPGAVTESNDTSASNCKSIQLVVNAIPVAPDLIPTTPLATGNIAGSPVTFRSTVTNSGTATTGAGFNNRLRIDLNSDGTFDVTLPNDPSPNPLAAGATEASPHIWTWPSAVAGTHIVEVCTDRPPDPNGVIVESNGSGTGESNNCPTHTFQVLANISWLQTVNGDVGSQSNIGDLDHSSGNNAATYVVIASTGKTISSGLQTLKSWLIPKPPGALPSYSLTLPTPKRYNSPAGNKDTFLGEFGVVSPPLTAVGLIASLRQREFTTTPET